MIGARSMVAILAAVARRPRLWAAAAKAVVRLGRPSRAWWEWRLHTAYGTSRARPAPADVVAWLEWCRSYETSRR